MIYLDSDNMNNINKTLTKYIISLVIVTIITIFLSYLLISNLLQNKIKTTYQTSNLIVEINPNINRELTKLTDIDGLNSGENHINITNISDTEVNYQILLTNLTSDESFIRLSINDYLIRNLSSFNKENNSYILGEYSLPSNYTACFNISLWLNYTESPINNNNYKFKLSIKEL